MAGFHWRLTFETVSRINSNCTSLTFAEYDPLSCLQYKLTSSYDRMTDVGPVTPLRVTEEGTSKGREAPPVDPARLLVKAWEEKVFPVIRRRFRSNTDRQSGLEQIKGALLAGMSAWKLGRLHDLYCFQVVVVVVNDVLEEIYFY